MEHLKKPLRFTLILLPFIIIGAYFAVLTSLSSGNSDILNQAVKEIGSKQRLAVISTVQPILLAAAAAFFGYILSEKTGLLRPFVFQRRALGVTLLCSVICGALFSLDAWTFAKWIPQVAQSYRDTGTFDAASWLGAVLYGGIAEELMLRLFFMSLLAFLAHKLFFKDKESVPVGVLISANGLTALLFAAAHLPATALLFGTLTPLIVLRCFLMNGAFGLLFGHLYRRYGIQYAMLSHMLLHIISKTVWLIAF